MIEGLYLNDNQFETILWRNQLSIRMASGVMKAGSRESKLGNKWNKRY